MPLVAAAAVIAFMRLAQFGKEIQRTWRKRDRIGAIEIVQFALRSHRAIYAMCRHSARNQNRHRFSSWSVPKL
jgi:hypothetical protein